MCAILFFLLYLEIYFPLFLSINGIISILLFLLVGPNSVPYQLMVGFFAYAKSREITVDKKELEGN